MTWGASEAYAEGLKDGKAEDAAEIERLREHLRIAIMSDSEECKVLTADNERLRAALEAIVAEDDAAACCGKGRGYGDQLECCGDPEYGIDRAQRIARAALTAQPAAPGGEND